MQQTKATQIAITLNGMSTVVAAWTLFFPRPYEYAIVTCIAIPIISILAVGLSKGFIRIDHTSKKGYPGIFFSIFASSIAMLVRALLDFSIFDYGNASTYISVVSVVLIILIAVVSKEFNVKIPKTFFALGAVSLFIVLYSYGSVILLNCFYDKSDPEIFKAKILNKEVRFAATHKNVTYYLELSPWGKYSEANKISVSQNLYDRLATNAEVDIQLRKGRFNISWFRIVE